MLANYFRTALRSLTRHRGYTLINIIGLAVGMAACLLVLLYLDREFSYDTHHQDVDRLYRLVRHVRPADVTCPP